MCVAREKGKKEKKGRKKREGTGMVYLGASVNIRVPRAVYVRIMCRVRNLPQDDERGVKDAHPAMVVAVGNPAHEYLKEDLGQGPEHASDVDAVELADDHLGRRECGQSRPASAGPNVAVGRVELCIAGSDVRGAGGLSCKVLVSMDKGLPEKGGGGGFTHSWRTTSQRYPP